MTLQGRLMTTDVAAHMNGAESLPKQIADFHLNAERLKEIQAAEG